MSKALNLCKSCNHGYLGESCLRCKSRLAPIRPQDVTSAMETLNSHIGIRALGQAYKKQVKAKEPKRRIKEEHRVKNWGLNYCNECDMFTIQGGLEEHMKSHKDIKPKEWQIV